MIILDCRETELISRLPSAETKALGTGDVDVCNKFLFERKTVSDLAASIRDGRWRDQLKRLCECRRDHGYAIALLVVGRVGDHAVNGVSAPSLRSALAGAFARDLIPHFTVADDDEAAAFLAKLDERCQRGEPDSTERAVPLPKRGDSLRTPRDVAVAQMSLIQGVTKVTAECVLGEHENMASWIGHMSGMPREERVRSISELKPRSTRRIGSAVAGRIVETVFGP